MIIKKKKASTKSFNVSDNWHIIYVQLRVWHDLRVRHNLIIQNFTTSWIHNKWSKRPKNCELCKRFFSLNKQIYAKKTRNKILYIFAGIMSLTPDSELYNFITSWELITTPQNFVQGSFSIKSLKLWHQNRGDFLASGPL